MSILAAAGMALASAAAQQAFTNSNREKDFANYQEAQEQNFQNSQSAQKNAPILTRLGMQAAGLNPVEMGTPTPASSASAPLGSHASPTVDISQSNALMAESRLKNAEAEKTELENDITKGENEASYQTYIDQLEDLTSAYKDRGWTQQAEHLEEERNRLIELKSQGKLKFNVGNLRGAVKAFSSVQALQERMANTLDQLLKTETNFRMLVGGQSVPLSKMPEVQRKLMMTQISNNIATSALLASQKNLTDEQKNEIIKMQEKLEQDIELAKSQKQLTDYQAKSIYLADWKQLYNDGETMAAITAKADETMKTILEQTGSIANSVVNAKTGGKIAKSLGNRNSSAGNGSGEKTKTMLNRSIPRYDENVTW